MLATGRLVERPVAIEGMLAVRHRIWANVAIDHRGADGEAGGRFLAALERRLNELPAGLSGKEGA
jgi:pyruvate/2-oxoglutarate dehydrogenase complex dihydrolipoamide acyltransferase (E2) component